MSNETLHRQGSSNLQSHLPPSTPPLETAVTRLEEYRQRNKMQSRTFFSPHTKALLSAMGSTSLVQTATFDDNPYVGDSNRVDRIAPESPVSGHVFIAGEHDLKYDFNDDSATAVFMDNASDKSIETSRRVASSLKPHVTTNGVKTLQTRLKAVNTNTHELLWKRAAMYCGEATIDRPSLADSDENVSQMLAQVQHESEYVAACSVVLQGTQRQKLMKLVLYRLLHPISTEQSLTGSFLRSVADVEVMLNRYPAQPQLTCPAIQIAAAPETKGAIESSALMIFWSCPEHLTRWLASGYPLLQPTSASGQAIQLYCQRWDVMRYFRKVWGKASSSVLKLRLEPVPCSGLDGSNPAKLSANRSPPFPPFA